MITIQLLYDDKDKQKAIELQDTMLTFQKQLEQKLETPIYITTKKKTRT